MLHFPSKNIEYMTKSKKKSDSVQTGIMHKVILQETLDRGLFLLFMDES